VFSGGSQRVWEDYNWYHRMMWSGAAGKLQEVWVGIGGPSGEMLLPAQPVPEWLDWDMWLGPAPWRPYNRQYVDGGWRGHFDFDSGAKLLDWGAHTVDLCQWAKGADGTAPVEYEPSGGTIYARYSDGVRLVMRPDGWLPLGTCPVRFEGEEGWVETGDTGKIEAHPQSLLSGREVRPEDGISPGNHVRDFLNCVKSRARPATDADVARSSHVACHVAAIAWQLGREVTFDPAKEEFVGDEEANRYLARAMRAPWTF
jgi:hypothetical protein